MGRTKKRRAQGRHQVQEEGQKPTPPACGTTSVATGMGRTTTAGRLYFDMQKVWVSGQSPLIQCTWCLGYGHSKGACRETEDVCAHCGGKHVKTDCPQWSDRENSVPSCINCFRAKMTKKEHSAFDPSWPIRSKWDEIASSRVSYSLEERNGKSRHKY